MKTKLVAKLFEHEVIQIAEPHSPFRLASGKTSLLYLDHRKIFSIPELRKDLVQLWCPLVERYLVEWGHSPFEVCFAGTATAGIVPAYVLAEYFSAGFVYVRSEKKSHGLNQRIEGHVGQKMAIVVVDDMCTTGSSIQKAIEVLREELPADTCKLAGSCSITSRDSYGGPGYELPFFSFFKVGEMLDTLKRLGLVTSEQREALGSH